MTHKQQGRRVAQRAPSPLHARHCPNRHRSSLLRAQAPSGSSRAAGSMPHVDAEKHTWRRDICAVRGNSIRHKLPGIDVAALQLHSQFSHLYVLDRPLQASTSACKLQAPALYCTVLVPSSAALHTSAAGKLPRIAQDIAARHLVSSCLAHHSSLPFLHCSESVAPPLTCSTSPQTWRHLERTSIARYVQRWPIHCRT